MNLFKKGNVMKNELPAEFIKELTLMTIQKEVRWMEYDNQMEDFRLQSCLDESILGELSLFLCGYCPDMDMELAIQVFEEDRRGIFSSIIREGKDLKQMEFSMADFQKDFELNMLVYAANTQVLQREMEQSYREMSRRLAAAGSGCAGCPGCS